jgi:hypothetical protein
MNLMWYYTARGVTHNWRPTPPKRFYLDHRRTRYKYTQVYPSKSKEKPGVLDRMPELTITSTYVHSKVDPNTFTMGNPIPGSTLTPCQSRLYPIVRDFGFVLRLHLLTSLHVSQTVVEEGELEAWRPRFGATGDMRLELLTLTGIPQDQLSCSTISRCFLQPSQTEGEIRYRTRTSTLLLT